VTARIDVVDRDDVVVLQRSDRAGLAEETIAAAGVGDVSVVDDLHCDVAAERLIPGLDDVAHRPCAEHPDWLEPRGQLYFDEVGSWSSPSDRALGKRLGAPIVGVAHIPRLLRRGELIEWPTRGHAQRGRGMRLQPVFDGADALHRPTRRV
jgi:hypothetical protein